MREVSSGNFGENHLKSLQHDHVHSGETFQAVSERRCTGSVVEGADRTFVFIGGFRAVWTEVAARTDGIFIVDQHRCLCVVAVVSLQALGEGDETECVSESSRWFLLNASVR